MKMREQIAEIVDTYFCEQAHQPANWDELSEEDRSEAYEAADRILTLLEDEQPETNDD